MLRNSIVVLAIVLVFGSSGLSTNASARGGGGEGDVLQSLWRRLLVILPVTAMTVTVTALAVRVADFAVRRSRCVGRWGRLLWAP